MSSFARVLSLILATQACWAAQPKDANLVRKSGSKRITMSVSPSGKIDEAEGLEMLELGATAETMLEELEDFARAGASPGKERINDIKKIVEDELLPDLKQTRDSEANQVKTNLKAIAVCNANAHWSHNNIKATTQAAVDQARKDHAACREEEKNKHSDKNSKCAELDDFLKTINVPADLPANRPRDAMVQYVKTMSTYFCPKGPQVTTLDEACTSATAAHGKHKDQCEKLQDAFELGFCTWRTELTDTCTNLKNCYDGALEAYNVHVAATKTLVTKWKTEYAALKKISCYVDVWLKDSNVNTADADQLAHCHASNIDTSPMNVDYGTPAAKAQCSQELQRDYPGSPGFVSTEYSNFKDYVDEVTPCVSQTTAVMTTTLAPVTEATPTVNVVVTGYGTPESVLSSPIKCGAGEIVATKSGPHPVNGNCEAYDQCRIDVNADCKVKVWLRDRCTSVRGKYSWSDYTSDAISSGSCKMVVAKSEAMQARGL